MGKQSTLVGLLLIFTLTLSGTSLILSQVTAQNTPGPSGVEISNNGQWWQVNTSTITILFPYHGQKPMFLWYYNDNSSQIYSVKYRGLVEYLPLNGYYTPDCEANAQTMYSLMLSNYGHMGGGGMGMSQIQSTIDNAYQNWRSEFHPSYLPFSACNWQLTDPIQATDQNGNSYVSFNMTLNNAPSEFKFAQNNVAFNCWLYANQTTLNPYGLGSYTIGSGEMETGFSVGNWSWNSNYMSGFFGMMHQNYGYNVASQNNSLALWCDFATITQQDLNAALNDANSFESSVPANSTLAPTGILERNSTMTDIIAGGHQIRMQAMSEDITTSLSIPTNTFEGYRMQFAQGDKTLPGFFTFQNQAAIINPATQQASPQAAIASYRTESNYMQLFICYPYFGANTLYHGPSVGIDTHAQLIPEYIPAFLIIIAITLAATIMVTKKQIKKRSK